MSLKTGPLSALGACAVAVMLNLSPAQANQDSETYIGLKAQSAIASLNATGSSEKRSSEFVALMEQFADVGDMSVKMLGVYGRTLRDNPALASDWKRAFEDYAMVTYEDQLDKFRASKLTVTGSRDAEINGRLCSRVSSQLSRDSRPPVQVFWYVCKSEQSNWRVNDVGLDTGGGEIKVLINERAQFEAVLSKNGGDISKLIAQLKDRTLSVQAKLAASRG